MISAKQNFGPRISHAWGVDGGAHMRTRATHALCGPIPYSALWETLEDIFRVLLVTCVASSFCMSILHFSYLLGSRG